MLFASTSPTRPCVRPTARVGWSLADRGGRVVLHFIWRGVLTEFWTHLPIGRVTRLCGASAEAIALSLDPAPDAIPAIVRYSPDVAASVSDEVSFILSKLERV